MSQRVTKKDLKNIVTRINNITKNPTEYFNSDGEYNVGHYHLSGAYGGWNLYQTIEKTGACRDVLNIGHVSRPELQRAMFSYIQGLYDGGLQ